MDLSPSGGVAKVRGIKKSRLFLQQTERVIQ